MQKPWQEKKQRDENKSLKRIHDYEDGLQLHYESKRKELDLLISSSLPHQISNIKMVLWINFLFLGISTSLFHHIQFYGFYLVSYLTSFSAIVMMIIALTQRGAKFYGSIDDVNYVQNVIIDTPYPRAKMLAGLLNNTFKAVEYNRNTLLVLSKYLRRSIIATFIAIATFFIFLLTFNVFLTNNIKSAYPCELLILSKEKEAKINKIDILKR